MAARMKCCQSHFHKFANCCFSFSVVKWEFYWRGNGCLIIILLSWWGQRKFCHWIWFQCLRPCPTTESPFHLPQRRWRDVRRWSHAAFCWITGFRPAMNINCKEAIKWMREVALISALHLISCPHFKIISLKHKSFSRIRILERKRTLEIKEVISSYLDPEEIKWFDHVKGQSQHWNQEFWLPVCFILAPICFPWFDKFFSNIFHLQIDPNHQRGSKRK